MMKKLTAEAVASTIMERTPKLYEISGYDDKWSYDYGVVLKGFEKLWTATRNITYYDYILHNLDPFIRKDGSIKYYEENSYNIDFVNNGKLLFLLYRETGNKKYKIALDTLRRQLLHHPRTSEGVFWHKKRYPFQIWLDGLYMGTPFYAEYLISFEPNAGLEDIIRQFTISYSHLRDGKTGLLYHAWDERKVQFWANKETGTSPNFWGRAMGWYMMALIDTLEKLPPQYQKRKELVTIFTQVMDALLQFQDKETGLWYQIIDKGSWKGNYLESSCSSMIIYAMKKAINLNILPASLNCQVQKSREGLIREFVLLTKEGWINLNKTCQVAGLGGSDFRDGTYTYYISEPIIANDLKGIGAFLQALIEFDHP